MSTSIRGIKQENYSLYCFKPTDKREQVDFQPHDEKSHLQVYQSNGMKDWDVQQLKIKVKKKNVKKEDVEYFSDRKTLIEDKKEWIAEHASRRIQLFFQQAILCYNTPFVFKAEGAEDQIGIGSEVRLSSNCTHKTQAAHSSTFPCLYAYPKDSEGKIDESKRFVFLKYSHSYNQHNATVELPIEVNQADTYLDGKCNQNMLRGSAIQLINRVAQGKLDPTRATKSFLKSFEEKLEEMLDELNESDLRRDVVQIYLEHVREVRESVAESSEIFDQILGVKLPEPEEVLRKVVYKKRYELIQQAEFIESQVAKRIFEAQKQMFGNKANSFKKIDYRLRYALLQSAASPKEKKCLEKLFCTSLKQLRLNLKDSPSNLKRVENAVNQIKETKRRELNQLMRDLRVHFRDLEKLEFEFRSKLFRGLRTEYKGWKQREVVREFKTQFPDEPMSQAMVSRLERPSRLPVANRIYLTPESQRTKNMDIAKAEKIASTFGIDVGLFLPCLITSN